jgi:hypothetical protein
MTISDAASIAALVVDLVALYFLINIYKDDRAMRVAAEESLQVQKDYLSIRRKWYEGRTKKKDEKNVAQPGPKDGVDADNL